MERALGSKVCLILFMVFMVSITKSFACSVRVDDNYQKNLLVAHAANYNDVSLIHASDISLTSYAKGFSGAVGGADCPDYLTTSARISMAHKPKATETCSYTLTVRIRTYVGEEMPTEPTENVTFEAATAACSTRKVPRKRPIR